MRFTDIQERNELGLNLLQLSLIFLVGILQMFEGSTRIDIVARIDTHLLAIKGGDISGMGRKMHIGHQRRRIAICLQTGRDVLHILSLARALGSETNEFTASIDNALGLCHTTLGIIGIHRTHRLNADRIIATDAYLTHTGFG